MKPQNGYNSCINISDKTPFLIHCHSLPNQYFSHVKGQRTKVCGVCLVNLCTVITRFISSL